MFCFHKYGKIENGYQYCQKCGKVIAVPCNHKWETKSEESVNQSYGARLIHKGSFFILRCINCGEIKKSEIRVD